MIAITDIKRNPAKREQALKIKAILIGDALYDASRDWYHSRSWAPLAVKNPWNKANGPIGEL